LVDLRTRKVRWHVPVAKRPVRVSTVLLDGDAVVVTADGSRLIRLDRRTGRVVERSRDGGIVRSAAGGREGTYALVGYGTASVVRGRAP
jgi:hypothetical protein